MLLGAITVSEVSEEDFVTTEGSGEENRLVPWGRSQPFTTPHSLAVGTPFTPFSERGAQPLALAPNPNFPGKPDAFPLQALPSRTPTSPSSLGAPQVRAPLEDLGSEWTPAQQQAPHHPLLSLPPNHSPEQRAYFNEPGAGIWERSAPAPVLPWPAPARPIPPGARAWKRILPQ